MPRLQLKNGTVVQVSDTGVADKTQIVFIHGLGSSENFYGAVIASLKDRRCVSFDTPGAARSPVPAKVQSVKTISEDVIALLDTLGIPRAVLVGHSMGGIIASQTAADFPERVEKLVLIGPVNPSVNPSPEASEVWTQRIKLVQNDGMEPLTKTIPTAATASSSSGLAKAFIRELILSQPPEGYISLCNVIATAIPPEYEKIKCPTLIIVGEEDKMAPLDNCKIIRKGIRNARLEVLKDVGHWHCIEAPEQVSDIMNKFL